eukprot:GEMP01034247.1.p1 GENE.GEMP01034247.1~~GEMP01034247.1.p1  ORF type:complete len:510 (+),score=78.45 GEMP01034247.1:192-1721(+)
MARSLNRSSGLMSRGTGLSATSLTGFHRTAGFWGFYLIVIYCVIQIMLMLETLLMPFLWAFFICMGLVPFVDLVEDLMVFSYAFFVSCTRQKNFHNAIDEAWDEADQPRDDNGDRLDMRFQSVRSWAVLFVLLGFFLLIFAFAYLVYRNLHAVIEKKEIYHKGFARFGGILAEVVEDLSLPFVHEKQIAEIRSGKFFDADALQERMVHFVWAEGAEILFSLLVFMIYMIFWLFGPMPLDPSVRSVFQRYIVIKSSVSAFYALAVFALLWSFDVDMRVAFALLTFALNFVPEIGAIICIALPLPVILFDGRLEDPFPKAFFVLMGELVLKLIFGNVVEVIVLESDMQLRMHPVVILLCISFFGWAWGPTGMLLSVPIMAAFKALIATSAIPAMYRDPIVQAIEGDHEATARWRESRVSGVSMVNISPFKEARRSQVSTTTASRASIAVSRQTSLNPDLSTVGASSDKRLTARIPSVDEETTGTGLYTGAQLVTALKLVGDDSSDSGAEIP